MTGQAFSNNLSWLLKGPNIQVDDNCAYGYVVHNSSKHWHYSFLITSSLNAIIASNEKLSYTKSNGVFRVFKC